jgi:hypothetical protein
MRIAAGNRCLFFIKRAELRPRRAVASNVRRRCAMLQPKPIHPEEDTMATSTLDPENTPRPDRQTTKGTGTSALGPSDTSDSGSDVQGGLRWTSEREIGLDTGTAEDADSAPADPSAGPDIGDAALDSDTDSDGSGERATAGRDTDIEAGADIDVDRVDYVNPDAGPDQVDADAESVVPQRARERRQDQQP